jgi:Tfp pilus assembly PilM family ATPase
MAAAREQVNQLLANAAKARLDVIGMNVEPKAVVDCFQHIYRRKSDADTVTCFLDIGLCASRAVIARGGQIVFARTIPIGGEHFNKATAHAMRTSLDEAKLLRVQLCHAQPAPPVAPSAHKAPLQEQQPDPSSATDNSFALLGAGLQASAKATGETEPPPLPLPDAPAPAVDAIAEQLAQQAKQVAQACESPLSQLISELDLCRRYYESTFPAKPVDQLVFVGGEARQRGLCQRIAQELGLKAQVGDPIVRMGRISDVGIESGIDRRHPQPGWVVAIGLSLGPIKGQPATAAVAAQAGKA